MFFPTALSHWVYGRKWGHLLARVDLHARKTEDPTNSMTPVSCQLLFAYSNIEILLAGHFSAASQRMFMRFEILLQGQLWDSAKRRRSLMNPMVVPKYHNSNAYHRFPQTNISTNIEIFFYPRWCLQLTREERSSSLTYLGGHGTTERNLGEYEVHF